MQRILRVARLAGRFARAMYRFARLGFRRVSKAEQANRLALCSFCPYRLQHRPKVLGKEVNADRCEVCGCFLQAKTRLASEECPKGLWK